MNQRERFKRVMRFETVDRVPFWDYGYWKENIEVWKQEGLPDLVTCIEEYLGIETWADIAPSFGICPTFEPLVLEEDDRTRLVRDGAGVVKRESKAGSSIPQFVEFPVRNRRDWEALRERLDAEAPERFPHDWAANVATLNAGDRPVFLHTMGLFGFLRNIFGVENLSTTFYDDPQLILDIQEHMLDLRLRVLETTLSRLKVDAVMSGEDMAFNHGPLMSPAMYRRFMLPFYKRLTAYLADAGIDIIIVDSDGNINELLPLFIESGVTAAMPFEVRAGNDIVEVRRRYPRFGIIGGIDKMKLRAGGRGIDDELDKARELLPLGGFIPTVDHRVPPDVPYANYVRYVDEKYRMLHYPRTCRAR